MQAYLRDGTLRQFGSRLRLFRGPRRWLIVAVVLVVCIIAAAIALPLLLLTGGGEERPDPSQVVTAFFEALRRGDVGEAASLLAPKLRDELDLEPVRRRAVEAAQQSGKAELGFGKVEIKKDNATVDVWLAGEGRRVNLGLWRLVWLDGNWRISIPGTIGEIGTESPSSDSD